MDQRDTFDGAAEHYAAVRPGYPAALYDALGELGVLGQATRALEVGCGAGQATTDLARRAGDLVALDPGPRLVEEARARVTGLNVEFVVARFEDYVSPPGVFDLVASAQAWHWIPAEVGFPKAARLLRPGGCLAVFGHAWPSLAEALPGAMAPMVKETLPGAWERPHPSAGYRSSGPLPGLFAASGLFGGVEHRTFGVDVEMSPERFGRFLRTSAGYHLLPEAERFAVFDRLTGAMERAGGVYRARLESQLYVARRL